MPKFELPSPQDDGLLVPEVKEHSFDKHYFLARYIDAFTTGMKTAVKEGRWSGLQYIDLFAGAGVERICDTRRLSWGSPMIAAQSRISFQGLHFCELDREKFRALDARLRSLSLSCVPTTLNADANQVVSEIVRRIPQRSLTLAFIDPYGLHFDYATLKTLAQYRCDLIVFFPDYLDALRNWRLNYHDDPNSNLDRVLGPDADWRRIFNEGPNTTWPERLRGLYVRQIKKLGYKNFEFERISAKGRPMYQLIFCSKHTLGTEYWRGVSKKKPDGQDTFDFGSPD